jgi:glycosyltransferase involved in cell wall biosynthesis
MSLLEAQAAALPVVAGKAGGVAAVVADGETGLLVTPGDVSAFAGAVRALLDDPHRRGLMSKAASRHITGRHDLPAAARSLSAALGSLSVSGRCA